MKQFLYLDNDIVDSIVAQANRGLAQNFTVEEEQSHSDNSTQEKTIAGTASGGGSVMGLLKATGELSGAYTSSHDNNSTSISRGIVAKVLHDAAFDIALENMQLHTQNVDKLALGSFFRIKKIFSFVDISYLDSLFSTEELIDFLKRNNREEAERTIQSIVSETSREQRRANKFNKKEELEKIKEKADQELDDSRTIISILKSVVPYDRMLISDDGFLLPLEDKYFRVSPSNLGFKYGGEITCVGMITNIIEDNGDNEENIFVSLQTSINGALKELLPTQADKLFVAHPIAVFYENK